MNPAPSPVVPEVRSAALGDVGRLVELYGAAYAELRDMRGGRALLGLSGRRTPVAQSFQDQLGDPARSLVVGSDGSNVVGYGSSHAFELIGGERLGAIDELYVLPEARHAGTGRALAASLLEWCRGQGCTGVDAHALPGSRAVKSFFETEGFTARVLVMHRPLT